jgi:hypothetical protein
LMYSATCMQWLAPATCHTCQTLAGPCWGYELLLQDQHTGYASQTICTLRIFSACSDASMRCLFAARRVYAAFHPTAFETSLVSHQVGAATTASMLATDINEGRYEPSAPGEHCSVPSLCMHGTLLNRPACNCPVLAQQVHSHLCPHGSMQHGALLLLRRAIVCCRLSPRPAGW